MEVLFSDRYLIAVRKPGGLPAQADPTGDPHLLRLLAPAFPHDHALSLPHRLDRPVSGIILVTRTKEALAAMSVLFQRRAVAKTYWSIVSGQPPESGVWEHALIHDTRNNKARVANDTSGPVARTSFRILSRGDRYALVELVPEGGRFHQLRAQCAAAGFPIKGDVKYGARRGEKDRTIALHARSLAFRHPFTGEALHLEADPPEGGLWRALSGGGQRDVDPEMPV
ncbi:MAG TPA: RluA family pseudouridine synthase [Flavobacteriales bacterium]|nr:RluA family pseudouridine synthase [Flavobacteriales bacterium]